MTFSGKRLLCVLSSLWKSHFLHWLSVATNENTQRESSAASVAFTLFASYKCVVHIIRVQPKYTVTLLFIAPTVCKTKTHTVSLQHVCFNDTPSTIVGCYLFSVCVPGEYLIPSLKDRDLGSKEVGSILGTGLDFCVTLASYLICASISPSVNGNGPASPFL